MVDKLSADSVSASVVVKAPKLDKMKTIERKVSRLVYWIKKTCEWVMFYSIWTHAPPKRS